MSTSFNFSLAQDIPREALLDMLVEDAGFEPCGNPTPPRHLPLECAAGGVVAAIVFPTAASLRFDLAAAGIASKVSIHFGLDPSIRTGPANVFRGVQAVLQQTAGDAFLDYNADFVVLHRTDGAIALYDDIGLFSDWLPSVMESFHLPHVLHGSFQR